MHTKVISECLRVHIVAERIELTHWRVSQEKPSIKRAKISLQVTLCVCLLLGAVNNTKKHPKNYGNVVISCYYKDDKVRS